MKKESFYATIFSLVLVACVIGVAYRLSVVPYVRPEPEPESEPEPPHKHYKYVNITIYEKFRRPSYKWRRFGAVLSNGKLIQFHGECYASIEVGDLVNTYNWNWNWFYDKRWMEVWRNGTFIGTFVIWFY